MLEQQGALFSLKHNQRAVSNDLQKAFSLMEKATEKEDPIAYARADHSFHQVFFDYCGNQYLKEAYSGISWRTSALRSRLAGPTKLFDNRALAEHYQIIKNIERYDLDPLFETIKQHCVAMKGFFSKVVEEKLVEAPHAPPRLKGPRRKKQTA